MSKAKVEFIKQEHNPECRYCEGRGWYVRVSAQERRCKYCKGTGKFDNGSYHLIATKPDGTKIGFAVDNIK